MWCTYVVSRLNRLIVWNARKAVLSVIVISAAQWRRPLNGIVSLVGHPSVFGGPPDSWCCVPEGHTYAELNNQTKTQKCSILVSTQWIHYGVSLRQVPDASRLQPWAKILWNVGRQTGYTSFGTCKGAGYWCPKKKTPSSQGRAEMINHISQPRWACRNHNCSDWVMWKLPCFLAICCLRYVTEVKWRLKLTFNSRPSMGGFVCRSSKTREIPMHDCSQSKLPLRWTVARHAWCALELPPTTYSLL